MQRPPDKTIELYIYISKKENIIEGKDHGIPTKSCSLLRVFFAWPRVRVAVCFDGEAL